MSALATPILPLATRPTVRPPLPPAAAYTDDPIWRMPVECWHAMIAAGVLTSEDRVELVEGVLVYRMPIDEIHVAVCKLLEKLIEPLLDAQDVQRTYRDQAPVTLTDGEPQPDGAIVNGDPHAFARLGRKPHGSETLWIAEVANSTLRTDRGVKQRSYARAGIPTYWVVNLDDRTVEVRTEPDATAAEPAYRAMTVYGEADRVPVVVAGVTIGDVAVRDLLG